MDDLQDVSIYCKTQVNVFVLDQDQLKNLRERYTEFNRKIDFQERYLIEDRSFQPALDYIVYDPIVRYHKKRNKKNKGDVIDDYEETEYRNKLTQTLKNAIMQVWLCVKNNNTQPTLDEVI